MAAETARDLLGAVFDLLAGAASAPDGPGSFAWLQREPGGGLRLDLSRLAVRRPPRLYFSPSTSLVVTRQVLGSAFLHALDDLQPIDLDDGYRAPRHARRRRELLGGEALGGDAHRLFRLINHRYERVSTIITSNKGIRDWPAMLAGDEALATAILDRVLHHCHVLSIDGASYRLRHLEDHLAEA